MSQLSNYGENKIADFIRGQGLTLPSAWHLAPLSAYTETGVTELTGVGLIRVAVTRSLVNFSGTQGDGTTLASNGTTHSTSNNGEVDFGAASGSGTLAAVGFFDANEGGNCWMVWELPAPIDFESSDDVVVAAATIKFTLGLTGGLSDYLCNKLIDLIFRAQAYSMPASMWQALYTAAPTNAGGGTEVGGGVGYARAEIESTMTAWSGTQSAGSTSASSGTGGRISNNVAIAHPQPTGAWGTCEAAGLKDASSGGNLMFWHALAIPRTIGATSTPPTAAPDAVGITFA